MIGSYTIKIGNKRVRYELTVNRNITLIQGDSATGKSTLVKLIDTYYNEGKSSGIKMECNKNCVVLHGKDWQDSLERIKDSIVFIDEGSKFIASNDFAIAIKNSDNYYVIITREDLHSLPYSVNEIYGIKTVGTKLKKTDPVYNKMYKLYSSFENYNTIKPTVIIVEDSNAGYDFFSTVSRYSGIKCISASGKSKIVNYIIKRPSEHVLIVADGAAFGPEMREVMKYIVQQDNYALYLPESFEWLILKSGIFNNNKLRDILENVSNYVDSSKFFSWEQFFTSLLEKVTEKNSYVGQYNKTGKLNKFYKTQANLEKILSQMKYVDIDLTKKE